MTPSGVEFSTGSSVSTHSLSTQKYNSLQGNVLGPPVVKNDIMRIPVRLALSSGEEKEMLLQPKNLTLVGISPEKDTSSGIGEMRECRCMFCGEALLLESEEASIAHMEVCPSLQEQLNDTEHQFTLPKNLK